MENKTLKVLKPVTRILSILSIGLSVAAIAVLVLFNFSDVFTIITDEGTKYADGFSYPGYQAIFSGAQARLDLLERLEHLENLIDQMEKTAQNEAEKRKGRGLDA